MANEMLQKKIDKLKRMGDIEDMIEGNLCELARWRGKATRVTSLISAMPRGERDDVLAEAAAQTLLIETRLKKSIQRLSSERDRLCQSIEKVSDHRCRMLLKYRYIDRMTFEEIADKMHYTWRWVMKLHKAALAIYDEKENENETFE